MNLMIFMTRNSSFNKVSAPEVFRAKTSGGEEAHACRWMDFDNLVSTHNDLWSDTDNILCFAPRSVFHLSFSSS